MLKNTNITCRNTSLFRSRIEGGTSTSTNQRMVKSQRCWSQVIPNIFKRRFSALFKRAMTRSTCFSPYPRTSVLVFHQLIFCPYISSLPSFYRPVSSLLRLVVFHSNVFYPDSAIVYGGSLARHSSLFAPLKLIP